MPGVPAIEIDDGLKPIAQRSPSSPVDGLKQSKHYNPASKSINGMISSLDDGEGELDPDAVVAALKQHAKANRSNANLKKSIAALAALYVVTILAMLATSTAGALIAKDTVTEQSSGIQTTKDDVAVKTEVASYYADLMDLPKFGLDQLDHLESFSLSTDSGHINFKAAGYLMTTPDVLTLLTTSNAQIDIDTAAGTATIKINDQLLPAILAPSGGRRLLSEGTAQTSKCMANGACLHISPEHLHRNGPGRELKAKNREFSYATLSTSNIGSVEAISALLESISTDEDYYAGTAYAFGIPIQFSKSKAEGLRISIAVEGKTHLYANIEVNGEARNVEFEFDASGDLERCSDTGDVASIGYFATMLAGLGDVKVTIDAQYNGVDNSLMVKTPLEADCGDVFLGNVASATIGGSNVDDGRRRLLSEGDEFKSEGHRQMSAYRDAMRHMKKTPELQHHLHMEAPAGVDSNGRKLTGESVNSDTADIFGEMSADVYDGDCVGKNYGANWACVRKFEDGNAFMNHFERTVGGKKQCAFVFRGSNDFWDWISNIKGVVSTRREVCGRGINAHRGFVDEFMKTKDYITAQGCSSYYFSGHSLGGAMATIADVCFGTSISTSITFSSPQTWQNGGENHAGYRLYHEGDPVSGNLFGFLGTFDHAGGGLTKEIYWSCYARKWWGGCKRSGLGVRSKNDGANSGTFDTDFGAHSIDLVKSYIK